MSLLSGLNEQEVNSVLPKGIILLGYRGSIAHGTYVPSKDPNSIDDKDIMGVFIPSIDHYFGLNKEGHKEVQLKEWDSVSYELTKFIGLLMNSNPNVLSLLWLNEQHYIIKNRLGSWLIKNRDLFVSKKIYHSFTGYAHAQLHKMTHLAFEGYMGEKRKALVQKHGYDTKNAAHLIRLLRQGIEFLNEGYLHVQREDSGQLIDIKNGVWPLSKVKAEAERLFRRAEETYDRCVLPAHPDREKINELMIKMLTEHFRCYKK